MEANNDGGASRGSTGRYKECRRNHAMQIGRYAIDGCPEFLKGSGEEALLCAACGCHRSFHRREEFPGGFGPVMGIPIPIGPFHGQHRHLSAAATHIIPPPRSIALAPHVVMMNDHNGVVTTADELQIEAVGAGEIEEEEVGLKKKTRTKLMPWQKERMRAFAERLGWRVQSQHEDEIRHFCSQLDITPQVLRVWVKNNRRRWMQTGESSSSSATTTNATTSV